CLLRRRRRRWFVKKKCCCSLRFSSILSSSLLFSLAINHLVQKTLFGFPNSSHLTHFQPSRNKPVNAADPPTILSVSTRERHRPRFHRRA
ncbi:hypothetical protein BDV98DRAFT_568368, partial [Pterulicium gracile]